MLLNKEGKRTDYSIEDWPIFNGEDSGLFRVVNNAYDNIWWKKAFENKYILNKLDYKTNEFKNIPSYNRLIDVFRPPPHKKIKVNLINKNKKYIERKENNEKVKLKYNA